MLKKNIELIKIKVDSRDIRKIWVIDPSNKDRLIEAKPTHGWASRLLLIFNDRPINDSAWKRTRKQLRTYNRGCLTPKDLDIFYAQRHSIILNAIKTTSLDKHTSFFQNYSRFNSRKRNEIFTEDDIFYLQVGSIYFLTSNGLTRTSLLKALGFDKVEATVEKLLVTENISIKIINDTFTFINSQKEK